LQRFVARPKESWAPETSKKYGAEKFRLAGVAGTSAGAIAAVFIAAGAEANDLVDPDGRVPLCNVLGLDYFYDLFGIRGWRRVKFFRFFLRWSSTKTEQRIARLTKEMEDSKYEGLPPTPPPARKFRRTQADAEDAEIDQNGERETHRWLASRKQAWLFFFATIALIFVVPVIVPYLLQHDLPMPVYLIVLWIALHISFISVGKVTRVIENHRTNKDDRRYGDLLRAVVHPLASIFYAIVLTAILCYLGKKLWYLVGWPGFDPNVKAIRFPRSFNIPLLGAPEPISLGEIGRAWAWIACFGLYYVSARRTLRGFFKGSIAPEMIQRDLERILRHLLVNRCKGWNEATKTHEWEERKTVTDYKRELAARSLKEPITFKELFDATGVHLTVVTADAIRNEVEIYSAVTHPNESVAKAVSASMAIPFLFRPARETLKLLVDGAIVSSIPAWVFRRHRNRDPDCTILAARIEPQSYDYWIPQLRGYRDVFAKNHRLGKARFWWRHFKLSWRWPWALFINILSTGAFGARALELDASDRLESFSLWPSIGLLDFDISKEDLSKELARLTVESELEIANLLWERKQAFQAVCRQIEDVIRGKLGEAEEGITKGYIRMFWAMRDGNADSVRMKLTYRFDPEWHVDDRLVMPYGTSMSAFSMQTKESQFGQVEVLTQLQADRMNRYRAAVKWKKLAWCWAIPVKNPETNEIVGVLGIESDTPIAEYDPGVGVEANRRSCVWLKPNTAEIFDEQEKLLEAAKRNNEVRLRMGLWEESFARLVWRSFADLRVS
jgi:predicted acylesterase/phospholipase RssA